MKRLLSAVIFLAGFVQAELLLFNDTFNTSNGQDINADLELRQSGTQAPAEWNDNVGNNWQSQIEGGTMRLYKAGTAGSVFASLDADFAPIADDIEISVDMQFPNGEAGFAMVNFGLADTDGFSANAGYSFRVDNRTGDYLLGFYDNGAFRGQSNVTAYVTNINTLVVHYQGGNAVSATFNGWQYVFSSGNTNYAGTVEAENRIMLGWYSDGDPSTSSVKFDNVSVTAESIPAFPAFADITGPNLIPNGDFSALANKVPSDASQWNMTGTFGDFSATANATADLESWSHYYEDPNRLIPAVGTPHVNDGDGELDGTFYLDTHLNGDTVVLNSSMDYRNGLKQEDILNGVAIDSDATYQFVTDLLDPSWNSSESAFTVALTTGSGSDVTNTANAVAGTLQQLVSTALPSSFGSPAAVSISGADLLAVQGSGPVNVIFNHVCDAEIPGFPGGVASNDVKNIALVSQVQLDSVSLHAVIEAQEGDLNKDGVVDQDDADLAQNYLDGNGGLSAADRQAALIGDGMTAAEALAALNLSDFDIDGDGSFTAGDVTAVRALTPWKLKMALNGAMIGFEWESTELKQYDVETCTSLENPVWTKYNDGVATYENILASGTGTNTLSAVLPDDSMRFFRVVEEAGPTSFISVESGSFEDPPGASGSWSVVHPVWNPTGSSLYQLNMGTTHFTTSPDGSWMALMNNIGTISQDLATTVNAGDTLTVTFSGGNAKSESSTTGGGVFNAVFRVGTTPYTMAVDTTGLDPDTWQTYTNTVTVSNSGSLSVEFTTVSGKPWLDNIGAVTRTEPR
ncbi:dockerin type I repeat-containing protein [Tichowtungia aerotolerans]|uniref:Dockerin domain-containing protein n=1 Tax=Tichowtungia aerotolerans TaxID=2697043 RepID=A0A6P1M1I8_9BACT|nr:dockerin type I repeat-containing protein [Tichowtungia aerotolerans]QHI68689.1 hypothetical protein GT409_04250 [Tichowtungia aerotolerans]